MSSRFIQIHWLASYPATLLNRDEAGLAKRIPFGGTVRSRISSQCLKRHWRVAGQSSVEASKAHPWSLANVGVPTGSRSKEVVERKILPHATVDLEASQEAIDAAKSVLVEKLYGSKAGDIKQRQALFFGDPEIEYLARRTREALERGEPDAVTEALSTFFKEERNNLRALKHGAGLETALFGRMVTADPESNRDAAIHVAHALSVHAIERELDFMAVVDDLKREDRESDAGAAGVFDMELASGLYYGYTVVDVPLLVNNLAGDAEAAARVIEHLAHLIADVSPGAKKGSTAPYSYAEFMLVEAGDRQPRTLANAFRRALRARDQDMAEAAVDALAGHLARMDQTYQTGERRRQLTVLDSAIPDCETVSLDELARFAGSEVGAERT